MNKLIKLELSFGTQLDRDGVEISDHIRTLGIAEARQLAADLFGGCTLIETNGDWKDETGRCFSERGATLVILTTEGLPGLEGHIKQLAEDIKDSLYQKSVLVVRYPVQAEFI